MNDSWEECLCHGGEVKRLNENLALHFPIFLPGSACSASLPP